MALRMRFPLLPLSGVLLAVGAALTLLPSRTTGQLPAANREKSFTFPEFRATPWSKGFRWLADETGVPVVCPFTPTGTFTFVPLDPTRHYSLAEVMDILNDA